MPQEVASAFASAGNRVLFVENTGVRRPTLRDAARLWSRLKNWMRARDDVKYAGHGVDVYSPLLLPLPHSRLATRINSRVLLRAVRNWFAKDAGRPLVVITFLPTLLIRTLIGRLRPAVSVYYCADRLGESSPGAQQLYESEERMFEDADLVLVTSEPLHAAASRSTNAVELLACGVRSREFERARHDTTARPLFDGVPGPIVGFAGTIRNELDVALLGDVAELAPDLSFVFIGPISTDVRRLEACPNVHFPGAVSHAEVVRSMVHFDVGILPYALNDYTAAIMPMKLKEYLAAALPVVATPLPELRRFDADHPGVLTFAADAPSFVTQLRASTAENDHAKVAQRMEIARHYDWSEQMARMSELVEELLAR